MLVDIYIIMRVCEELHAHTYTHYTFRALLASILNEFLDVHVVEF